MLCLGSMNLEFKVEFNANIEKVELRDVLFFLKKEKKICRTFVTKILFVPHVYSRLVVIQVPGDFSFDSRFTSLNF